LKSSPTSDDESSDSDIPADLIDEKKKSGGRGKASIAANLKNTRQSIRLMGLNNCIVVDGFSKSGGAKKTMASNRMTAMNLKCLLYLNEGRSGVMVRLVRIRRRRSPR
jgi:hypothetical protein